MLSNLRTMAICIGVTGVTSILLWFYFKNKIDTVESKLDNMFSMIQNFSANEPPLQDSEYVEDPFDNKELQYKNEMVSQSLPDEEQLEEQQEQGKWYEQQAGSSQLVEVSENEDDEDNKDSEEDNEESEEDGEESEEEEDSEEEQEQEEEEEQQEQQEEQQEEVEELVVKEVKVGDNDEEEDSLDEITDDEDEPSVKKVDVDVVDYHKMKVSELKNTCAEKGLTGYTKLNKKALVNLLENNQ